MIRFSRNFGHQTAVTAGSVSGATDKAFDGLARMAAIRGTGDQKAGVAGAVFNRLVHRFLGCADPAIAAGADEQNFGGALGAGWVFEVRGKASGQNADPAGGAYERGSTGNWWAAEAAGTWADAITTSTLTAERVLIYGYETSFLNVSGRFGGSSFEQGTAIAVDANGNAYVTGYTYSTNFPTTAGAFQPAIDGNSDAFVTKLNASIRTV